MALDPVPQSAMGPSCETDVHVGCRAVVPLNGPSAPKNSRTQLIFLQAAQDKYEEKLSTIFMVYGWRHHGACFCTEFYAISIYEMAPKLVGNPVWGHWMQFRNHVCTWRPCPLIT